MWSLGALFRSSFTLPGFEGRDYGIHILQALPDILPSSANPFNSVDNEKAKLS
jgi:hypothetical protein